MLLAAGETMAMVAPREAERLHAAQAFRVDSGGAESNVAGHVAALGHPSAWFSRLGADPLGDRILQHLTARGIDVSTVIRDAAHPTGLYVKDPGHGVHYYRAGSAASFLCAADADAVDLDGVQVLHVSGITAVISPSAAEFLDRIITRAHDAGVLVSFDVNHRPALWDAETAGAALKPVAARADIVFVGRDEAERLWGTATPAEVRALLPGVGELVVKDGAHGATTFAGQDEVFVPARTVEVVEEVGAGDAFAGGYLAALLDRAPIDARLQAGHARAALTLTTTADWPDDPEEERR
ncbi:sugar kinase [Microbacterium rhizosphaerae]|uniref:Sugar kinase n=1 Tax=Microbacterium rhizosphaerae TaxID=1678237 RepID=A0ABZ0SRU1_9MICO|nr:sugar kinase [Microbacterium rhizosphaerae]WPR91393.1 sugar kinase [Microbacterium rhizosphaerae]